MEIRSLLVNLDVDAYSPDLLKTAIDLAKRFGARISAVIAAQAAPSLVGIEGGTVAASFYEAERSAIESRLASLEYGFREGVPASIRGTCLAMLDAPNHAIVGMARRADLIICGPRSDGPQSLPRHVDIGALVLAAGRPVLIAAPGTTAIAAKTVVVGWRDTREARRALVDALPFLKAADDVVLATITEGDRAIEKASLEDVIAWLHSHDVKARGDIHDPAGPFAATLEGIARELKSDLIVTGAYGHSRTREWLFGGVTRDLLASAHVNRFMSN